MSYIIINVNVFKGSDSEIWKPIPGYSDYQASNLGRIKSLKFSRERILKSYKDNLGYLHIVLRNESGKKHFYVHRLVGMAFLGIPDELEIDHINGIPSDNRLENLRVCTHAENAKNRKKRRDNTTGYPGASFHKQSGKYQALIRINGKLKHLGLYDTAEEAATAYQEASLKHHGAFSPFVSRDEFKALAEKVSTFVSRDEFKTLESRVSTLERLLNPKRKNNNSEGAF